MTFLAPLFLLGSLAIALPIVFHLIRRTTRQRTIFSSLMFLSPSPPRLTRRSRLEHILLLILRCAVLCLLAFGFARPLIKQATVSEPSSGAGKRMAVLLDTSASMRRADLWSDARAKAESILRKTTPLDQVALFSFDRQLQPIISFEQWEATPPNERVNVALSKLATLSPGWSATQIGHALISAAEALADTSAHGQFLQNSNTPSPENFLARQIVLISDFHAGSRVEQLQGYEWPKGVEISVEALKPRRPNNASLQLVTDADDSAPKTNSSVRIRVANAPGSKVEQFRVGWARAAGVSASNARASAGAGPATPEFVGQPQNVYVAAGQSRIVPVPSAQGDMSTAALAVPDRIVLTGDDEDFDNTVFVVPPDAQQFSVLYFGPESEQDARQPFYFVKRAFQQTQRQTVKVQLCSSSKPPSPAEMESASLLIVADVLSPQQATEVRRGVESGKILLFLVRNADNASTLAQLLNLREVNIAEASSPTDNRNTTAASYAMLGEIDFRHPLFAPFADPRFSDFTKIHFWKHRRVDPSAFPGARTVAKFDNGDPALLEQPLGKGRAFVLTSSWHPEDSQLALSTKFVPMLYALLEMSGPVQTFAAQYRVGDPVPLPGSVGTGWLSLPDGSQVTLSPGTTNFSQTLTPGIYALEPAAGGASSAEPSREFVVNLDPAETRTAPMSADELERLGAPVKFAVASTAVRSARANASAERKAHLQNAELENRQKLWRWVILVTLGILLLETWLAGRTNHRLAPAKESTPEEATAANSVL